MSSKTSAVQYLKILCMKKFSYATEFSYNILHKAMISVKSLYILCLFFVFAYSIIKSLLYFLEQPTTFEENELEYSSSLPSLTLCFRQFEPDNFTTFQDIMQRIQDVETGGFIDGLLVITGKGVKRSFFDLRNKSVVEKNSTLILMMFVPKVFILSLTSFGLNPCIL